MKHLFKMERPVNGIEHISAQTQHPFQPLPKPTGASPFHLDIKTIISPVAYAELLVSKKLIFQTAGDSGGVHNPHYQQIVADHMEWEFDKNAPANNPLFFYHLGDIVYYFGKMSQYHIQFYEPYKFYPAPILGIPGNHDGDVDPTDPTKPKSLAAFVALFCSKFPIIPPVAFDAVRTTMTQPNVFWTLVTPVANIIGLYSNVPGGGEIQADQQQWFVNELKTANKDRNAKALIVALHHPPYSMDADVGSSTKMQKVLDDSFTQSGVVPDIVLSGHVHNYQRFTRKIGTRQVPYIVAGAGGYWHLHPMNIPGKPVIKMPSKTPFENVVLEKYCEDRHGFLRIEIDMQKKQLTGKYITVPGSLQTEKDPSVLFDSFTIDLAKNKIK